VASTFSEPPREYERTRPWITFHADLRELPPRLWVLIGEAESKCDHVAAVPLKPEVAERLNTVYLSKGVHGTTAIEGNTLSEEEVRQIIEGAPSLPRSRDYLEQEVRNILASYNGIIAEVTERGRIPLTTQRICAFNDKVLHDLDLEPGVAPGRAREDSVGVRLYLGAPARDCELLLDRMCAWLNGPEFQVESDDPFAFTKVIAKAIMAHLYIAWIHPFGDGNGRTARLVEFQVLIESGVPVPAAHLLSDHYNLTRDRYYRVLDRTSRSPYPVTELFEYALQGFIDGLREQLDTIRAQQLEVTWENYVHEQFRDEDTPARRRQRHIALDLPAEHPTPRSAVKMLSPRVSAGYANRGPKTITRDLNALEAMGLLIRVPGGVRPNRARVLAFLPHRADGPIGGIFESVEPPGA